jgi:hypothetical protein
MQWLNEMMGKVRKEKEILTAKQLADSIQLIYSTCLKEIIR